MTRLKVRTAALVLAGVGIGLAAAPVAALADDYVHTEGGSRIQDTAAAVSSALDIEHSADGTGNTYFPGQTFGLDVHNNPGARSGIFVHQYSRNGPAAQIDNTDSAPSLVINNTQNPTRNPGGDGTGDFLRLVDHDSSVLHLDRNFTWTNESGSTHPLTYTAWNGPALSVNGQDQAAPVQQWQANGTPLLRLMTSGLIQGTGTGTLQLDARARLGNSAAAVVVGASAVQVTADRLGFYSAQPTARPTVTGSRSDGSALRSLLAALAREGLIVDRTTH